MLFPSHASSFGLSIHASNSILATGTTTSPTVDDSIAQRIDSCTLESGANGGYLSSSFLIGERGNEVEDWLAYGLGRHIEVFDEFQVKVWEGFVNQVSANIAGVAITRGPLMNIVNRAKAIYQTIRYDTNPPIGGNQAITSASSFTASQEAYGIFEDMVSLGEATLAIAEFQRDSYLQEKKDPETQTTININGNSSASNVRIDCLGYSRMLETYFYTNTSPVTNTVAANTKLLAVFAAQPNSIFSTAETNIEDSGLTVGFFERGDRRASEIVSSIVGLGNTTQNRFICGVLNDRTIYYKQVPSSILYEYKINDNSKRVDLIGGTIQSYWSIQSGKWINIPDMLIGQEQNPSAKPIQSDPRNIFIESIQYGMPYNLTMTGGKVAKLPQILAQFGITSV